MGNYITSESEISPMSLGDPNEPSPSPLNPVKLRHSLRIASRVSIESSVQLEKDYFTQYPSPSLARDLDKTINAFDLQNILLSPVGMCSDSSSYLKYSNLTPESLEVGHRVRPQTQINAARLPSIGNITKKTLTQGKGKKDDLNQRNEYNLISQSKESTNKGIEEKFNNDYFSELQVNTRLSLSKKQNNTSCYPKWINNSSFRKLISKFIPKFLLPALRAIENLKIRFAKSANYQIKKISIVNKMKTKKLGKRKEKSKSWKL
ncbi:uncharacterized protein CMU_026790 [Cryptosporidium muris RN66]|uniref:Uncharacterized protein n=1 Tax=Cryptosporidium muris (strain RN66) TaxID=441375 RepID=B6ABB9_CRYMR|nr:uncharacterized protein CMU_026790 [Cryptosporidium muris RN66]EEA05671.1 hypothetical protein CMU_026790 [Cryptosporidium muris RN66]|eukprot:XP_002140020.1 hypothetical protein [Cryptosporidium muris RN66]